MGDGSRLEPGGWWEAVPFLPRLTDNGGSEQVTNPAEWCYAAGIDSGRHSEGKSQRTPGWEVGEREVKGDVQIWGLWNWGLREILEGVRFGHL